MALSWMKQTIYNRDSNGFPEGLVSACSSDTLPELRERLKSGGTDFAREDFLELTYNGCPVLACGNTTGAKSMPLYHIDYIIQVLNEVGDPLKVEDFLIQFKEATMGYMVASRKNIIAYAGQYNLLDKIFKPEGWINRVADMEALYRQVPHEYKNQIDFDKLKAETIALGARTFTITPSLKKEELFTPNDQDMTPLDDHRIWKKLDLIVKTLSANGEQLTKADILRKNGKGKTYLELAAAAGQEDKIFTLLERQGDRLTAQDIQDHNLKACIGNDTLWNAAQDNNVAKIKTVLALGLADLEYKGDTDNGTALWRAAKKGYAEIAELLIEAGANVTYENKNVKERANVLNIGAYWGTKSTVEKLIAALEKRFADEPKTLMAELTKPDYHHDTPLMNAEKNKGDTIAPVIEAAIFRAQCKMMNPDDIDIAQKFAEGKSILNMAVLFGDAAMVQKIVAKLQAVYKGKELYESLTKPGTNGKTPETVARNTGKVEIADLIKAASDDALVAWGRPEDFVQAAENGDAALVRKFLDAGTIDIDAQATNRTSKCTALFLATFNKRESIVDLLLDKGANPDIRTADNRSAFTAAIDNGMVETIKKMLPLLRTRYADNPLEMLYAFPIMNTIKCHATQGLVQSEMDRIVPQLLQAEPAWLSEAKVIKALSGQKLLGKLFIPELWKGHLAELEKAWKNVADQDKGQVDYAKVFSQAYFLTYPIDDITGKEQLLPKEGSPQCALEFKPTWEHIDQITHQLDRHGERLTRSDLRQKASTGGSTLLRKAIEFGATDSVFDLLAIGKERLEGPDLLDRNGGEDKSVLDLIAEQGKLALVFNPDHWANDVRTMQACWARVSSTHRQQLDGKDGRPSYKHLLQEANALSVKALQLNAQAVGA